MSYHSSPPPKSNPSASVQSPSKSRPSNCPPRLIQPLHPPNHPTDQRRIRNRYVNMTLIVSLPGEVPRILRRTTQRRISSHLRKRSGSRLSSRNSMKLGTLSTLTWCSRICHRRGQPNDQRTRLPCLMLWVRTKQPRSWWRNAMERSSKGRLSGSTALGKVVLETLAGKGWEIPSSRFLLGASISQVKKKI